MSELVSKWVSEWMSKWVDEWVCERMWKIEQVSEIVILKDAACK